MATEPVKGMTTDQMREESAKKVKMAQAFIQRMQLRIEAKQMITQSGFIENVVFWIDDEKYPTLPAAVEGPEEAQRTPTETEGDAPAEAETAPVAAEAA